MRYPGSLSRLPGNILPARSNLKNQLPYMWQLPGLCGCLPGVAIVLARLIFPV